MSQPSPVLTSLSEGVFTITLNRPDKRNALSAAMIELLHDAMEQAELNEAHVVVIRGMGKDFCAGADLDELLASADRTPDENERSALRLGRLFERIRDLPKPVIAVVHGRALAGGAGLATAADITIAAESGAVGYPEIRRAFVPAIVMVLLRGLIGEKAGLDLVLTGKSLNARDALALGLFSRVVPDNALESEVNDLASTLAASSLSALAMTKKLFHQLGRRQFSSDIALAARVNAVARTTPDFREAIAGFLSK